MPIDTTITRNDRVTRYGLACGYAESWGADGRIRDFYLTDDDAVTLYQDGIFHVKTRRQVSLPTTRAAGRTEIFWDSFESLTEARRWLERVRTTIRHRAPQPSGSWNLTLQTLAA